MPRKVDPKALLAAIREVVNKLLEDEEKKGEIDADDALDLAEDFKILDEWLTKGGYLPEDWDDDNKGNEPTEDDDDEEDDDEDDEDESSSK